MAIEETSEPTFDISQAAELLEVEDADRAQLLAILGIGQSTDKVHIDMTELLTAAVRLRNVPLEEVAGGALDMLPSESEEYQRAEQSIDKFLRELPLRKASDPEQFLAELREALPADRYRQAERIYANPCRQTQD